MTPSLFNLPLRLSDATSLAALLLETAGKPLSDDLRARLNSRALPLKLHHLRPFPASLERDPIHPAASYICVDGIENQPLLLRVAPASTPSSGLFPNAILIGRTRLGSTEAVLNAIPFGPADHAPIATFAAHVNQAFAPRPSGSRPVIRVTSHSPAEIFPAAFAQFGKLLRNTGQNQAAFAPLPGQNPENFHSAVVWSAIRAGWRQPYSIESEKTPLNATRTLLIDDLSDAAMIER